MHSLSDGIGEDDGIDPFTVVVMVVVGCSCGSLTPGDDPSDEVGEGSGENGRALSLVGASRESSCFESLSSDWLPSSYAEADEDEEEVDEVLDEVVDMVDAADEEDESEDTEEADDEPPVGEFAFSLVSSGRVGGDGVCFLISSKSNELTPLDSLPTGETASFRLPWQPMLTGEIGDSSPKPSSRSPTPDIGTAMLRAIIYCRQIFRADRRMIYPAFLLQRRLVVRLRVKEFYLPVTPLDLVVTLAGRTHCRRIVAHVQLTLTFTTRTCTLKHWQRNFRHTRRGKTGKAKHYYS